MTSTKFIIDSRDRITNHSFDSPNRSDNFVIKLPIEISRLSLLSCQIPLTYYIFNENYNKIIFRDNTDIYYFVEIPIGTYTISEFLPIFANSLDNADNISVGVGTWIGDNPGANFTVTFNDTTNKIILELGAAVGGVQFVSIADSDNPNGIPLGIIPGDIVGIDPIESPIRQLLNNASGLVGLNLNTTTPDPSTDDDGFPIGEQFAFDLGSPSNIPNSINLSGENYIYIKTDLAGLSTIQQAIITNIDINENDFNTILESFPDRGIIEQIEINQTPFTILTVKFENPIPIFLSQPTNEINFRLSFRNNLDVNLNGVNVSYVISVEN
jgi:hypothetical protein